MLLKSITENISRSFPKDILSSPLMSTERLAAQLETRIFYFYIVDQTPERIKITMYSTPYTLRKQGEKWRNASANLMQMSQELIDSVVATVLSLA